MRMNLSSIRVVRRRGCPWANGKWFAYTDIGGAAGAVVGPLLITWIRPFVTWEKPRAPGQRREP